MERRSNKPIPLAAHAAAEPLIAVIFIAAPWIFGFSDADDATTISIILGVLVLLTGMITRWRMALVKLLSLSAHRAMDFAVAAAAILAPFVFGFSDNGAATRFFIIMGVAEAGAALLTRWDARDDFATDHARATTGRTTQAR